MPWWGWLILSFWLFMCLIAWAIVRGGTWDEPDYEDGEEERWP